MVLKKPTRTIRGFKTPERTQVTKNASGGDVVRFVALGGLEEIGRNMMLFEYKDEIIVIDAGLQFPEADTPESITSSPTSLTWNRERRI